ncbi:MAG: Rieske 2Fe-2S domain-containing protein [Chloroflexi bacterium]|nr:Rieske 2Fe-2S domain-containing protein [Chloroflexota bacterium]
MTEHAPEPATAANVEVESPERRRFLAGASLAIGGLIAGLLGLPVIGFLLSPLIRPPQPQWIDLGATDSYEDGATRLVAFRDISPMPWAGLTAQTAVYVRRTGESGFTVFSVNCTHLGCPVNWVSTAQLFLCPCHGGVYYRDGTVAAGPPPLPLWQFVTRIESGHLLVQTRPLPPPPPSLVRHTKGADCATCDGQRA